MMDVLGIIILYLSLFSKTVNADGHEETGDDGCCVTEEPDLPDTESTDKTAITRDEMITLYTTILDTYDRRIRPLGDQTRSIAVDTKFVPKSIVEFDTTEQRFSVLAYIKVEWEDEFLSWNEDSYGGTNFVKMPIKEMWVPTMKIQEEFDGNNYIGSMQTDIAKVKANGTVQWVPEGMYSVVCEVDIKYYPYDEQTCKITYYIASESNFTVTLDHSEEVNLSELIKNSAWKVTEVRREVELKWGTYYVNIVFELQRRAHFATFTIIAPLLMLAFLNIGVFVVPNGSGEKGSLAITIFLSYGIFITIVSDTLPHNSLQVSYFVVFIISLLSVSAFSVVYAIIQAKLMATLRDKKCKLPCMNRNNNSVKSIDANDTDKVNDDKTESSSEYTWGMLLDKIDTIMCVAFFIVVSLMTIIFFGIMVSQIVNTI